MTLRTTKLAAEAGKAGMRATDGADTREGAVQGKCDAADGAGAGAETRVVTNDAGAGTETRVVADDAGSEMASVVGGGGGSAG